MMMMSKILEHIKRKVNELLYYTLSTWVTLICTYEIWLLLLFLTGGARQTGRGRDRLGWQVRCANEEFSVVRVPGVHLATGAGEQLSPADCDRLPLVVLNEVTCGGRKAT